MIGKISINDFQRNNTPFSMEFNCYWVTIKDENGNIVFERKPCNENWLSTDHRKITYALNLLEEAILSAINNKSAVSENCDDGSSIP